VFHQTEAAIGRLACCMQDGWRAKELEVHIRVRFEVGAAGLCDHGGSPIGGRFPIDVRAITPMCHQEPLRYSRVLLCSCPSYTPPLSARLRVWPFGTKNVRIGGSHRYLNRRDVLEAMARGDHPAVR
jgi:hypothetical protein